MATQIGLRKSESSGSSIGNDNPAVAGIPASLAPAPQPDARLDMLTEREVEVLRVIGRGMSNAEIASALVIGNETVKTHVSRVFAKLGLRDRVQAVVYAFEYGLVRPGAI